MLYLTGASLLFNLLLLGFAALFLKRLSASHSGRTNHETANQISFQNLITKVLSASVSVCPAHLQPVVSDSLKDVALFFDADYAQIMVISKERGTVSCEYEWCNPPLHGWREQMVSVDIGSIPWLYHKLTQNLVVQQSKTSPLPGEAVGEKGLPYIAAGMTSVVWLPIHFAGDLMGFFALGAFRDELGLSDQIIEQLRTVGDAFASSIERRRAASALAASEGKYRNSFDNAPFGIFQNTIDGKVLSVNNTLAKMIGAPSPEYTIAIAKDIAAQFYVHPDDRTKIIDMALNSDGFVTNEVLERRLDGTVYVARSRMRAVRGEEGNPLYVEGYLEDITEQKRTLEALTEAAAFVEMSTQLLSQFASCPSSQIDTQVVNALQRLCELMHVDHGLIILISDDRESFSCTHEFSKSPLRTCQKSVQKVPLESLRRQPGHVKRQGDYKRFHIDDFLPQDASDIISDNLLPYCSSSLCIPILNADGAIKGILKLGTAAVGREWSQSDISHLRVVAEAVANALQRAKIEEAVIASEQNYRSIFENAPIGIFQSRPNGKLISINEQLAKIMRYSDARTAVQSINDLRTQVYVHPEDRDSFMAESIAADGFVTREINFYRQDGSIFASSITMRAVKDKSGETLFLEGFLEDITEAKLAAEDLKRRLEIDKIMTSIVAQFAACELDEIDSSIDNALAELAQAFNAEHSYILRLAPDQANYTVINQWAAEGVQTVMPFSHDMTTIPVAWIEHLMSDQVVSVSQPSALGVPIHGKAGSIVGMIGLSSYTKDVEWTESDIAKLRIAGDAVAAVLERKRAEEELRSFNASLEQRVARRTSDADLQRRRAEEALAQLELTTEHLRLLSQAIDNSPAMVMITDSDRKIEYINPKFTEVTGYSPTEAVGKDPEFLHWAIEGQELDSSMASALEAGQPWSGQLRSAKKNGELFWEYASFAPIKGPSGEVRHYVAVKEDITERKALQDELTLARDEAERANKTKSLFLANMSHEIRTPMNAILGFSQLLQNNAAFDDVQRQHVDIINRSGEHLLALINDILEMSKIEAGRIELNKTRVELPSLVSDLSIMFRMRCADKNINFVVEHIDQLPPHIVSDENKLRQILTNLLGNSVKLTETGGVVLRVSVGPTSIDEYCLIAEVEDTGPGIADEERHKVFKPFEQTASGIRAKSGTGLGLAISQQFAHVLGGEITFGSQVDVGSTFRVVLPVGRVDSGYSMEARANMRVIGLAPGCKVRRVLVVDDEAENRVLLSSMLKEVGFETAESMEGSESLLAFEEWQPDLVLMDAQMPGMDGYDAIKNMRQMQSGRSVPIIAISASAFEEDRNRMLEAGADDFLAKPLRVETLFSTIATVAGATYHFSDNIDSGTLVPTRQPNTDELKQKAAGIPRDAIARIRRATIDADFDQVITIVNSTNGLDPMVGHALIEMAEQYEATRIISLLSSDN